MTCAREWDERDSCPELLLEQVSVFWWRRLVVSSLQHEILLLARRGPPSYRFLLGRALEGPPPLAAGPLVGRQGDVAALEAWYQQAAHGTRQLVFISGEAGVGKTTVVEMFLRRRAAGGERWTT